MRLIIEHNIASNTYVVTCKWGLRIALPFDQTHPFIGAQKIRRYDHPVVTLLQVRYSHIKLLVIIGSTQ
nr:MAG TPA: hypothetical protein [Caudoviricetes sp.]